MSHLIRSPQLGDVEQLCRMRVLMQAEIRNLNAFNIQEEYRQTLREYFSSALKDGSYLGAVAELNGELVASSGVTLYHKPPSLNQKSGLLGYVTNVYTDVPYRGRGIATDMIKFLIERARDAGVVRMHLGATAAGAGVYERVGFTIPRFQNYELNL